MLTVVNRYKDVRGYATLNESSCAKTSKEVLVRPTITNTIASSVQAKASGTVLPDKCGGLVCLTKASCLD